MFQLDEYLDGLQQCKNEEALVAYFEDTAKSVGFAGYNIFYGPLDARGRVTPELGIYDNSSLPEDLIETYDREEWFSVDPLLALTALPTVPFSTASAFAYAAPGSVTETMWHAMLDFKIEHELNIPVRRTDGAGQVSLHMAGRSEEAFEHFQAALPLAHTIMTAFFGVFENRFLHQSPLFLTPENPFTPREKDCLKWVAQGQSNADIAERLDVSVRTAKFHVENAMKKINARTRAEAVAIALTQDFIQL
ncbi:MAG: hypothetical protein HEP70_13160 [Rhodobiaceae bacterium]|nr:hypothetical protein [Rhodobiaceae bacterium]